MDPAGSTEVTAALFHLAWQALQLGDCLSGGAGFWAAWQSND